MDGLLIVTLWSLGELGHRSVTDDRQRTTVTLGFADKTNLKYKRKFVGRFGGVLTFQVRRRSNDKTGRHWTQGEVGVGQLRKPASIVTSPRQTTQSERVGVTQPHVQPTNTTTAPQRIGAELQFEVVERGTEITQKKHI